LPYNLFVQELQAHYPHLFEGETVIFLPAWCFRWKTSLHLLITSWKYLGPNFSTTLFSRAKC
jgi:hypothetical protein